MESTDKKEFRLQALRTALESGTMRGIHRMINALHPAEIASLLESLPPARREVVWELVDPEDEGEVLVELNDEVRANLISGMDADELVAAMEGMELDDLADIMGDLPEAVNRQVLRSLEQQDRERLRAVLAYPEDTAGGLMNTDTVTVRPDVVLEVVMRYLRARGGLPERTDQLFVVGRNDEYLGSLAIGRLLTHDPQRTVAELMDTSVEAINANLPEAEVASIFEDRDLLSAAVVDDRGALVGRITIDDVVDVIRDQADHSMMRMAGLDEDEDMFAPVFKSARRRAVWLGVNLATAFLAAWVVGLFQATLEEVVVLAVLMPIVASMGGIAGSQTLTLVIRGMALGQVARSNARWLIFKEIAVGLLNGFAWALVVALAVLLWFRTWEVGAIIAAALVINLLFAAIAGVGIPLLLKRLRIDPALAGTVILTTVTDVIGFMAFLGLGAFFLT
jgi:magnesium transporter